MAKASKIPVAVMNNLPAAVSIQRPCYAMATTDGQSADITMYGEIVEEQPVDWETGEPIPGQYIIESEFLDDLNRISGCDNIIIHMDSLGGNAGVSILVHNKLRDLAAKGAKLTCIVDGVAMSGGSLIMCACDTVKVNPSSLVMIHKFYEYYPKKRIISSLPFYDRVVNCAAYNVTWPIYSKSFYEHSYGSVPGKGPVRCANTIQGWMREAAAKPGDWYFVKMDITKFFFRIPTEVQLRELGRPLDDADMMWFFERAIRCDGRPLGLPLHCTDVTTAERIAGRGMQVGSLVSQMTANVVMTPADHYIKRELCAPYYARYMDDMGAIIEGKAAAWELVEEVDNYLQTNLGLNLNQKTAVIPIGNPVEFVGRKISPVKIELRRQTTLGMKKHLRYVQDAYAAGEIDLDYALSVITSYRGLFKDVTSDAFLEKMLDEFVLSRPALEA